MAIAIGGVLYTSQDAERLTELKEQYDLKNQQLQLFLSRSPAPTKANLAVLEQNYEQLMDELRKSQASLNLSTYDEDLFFGEPPTDSNDAFFMIAKYVEDARKLAASSGVKIVEGYRFGFDEFENVGPPIEIVSRVHRQSKIMESLLQALFDSGISEFISIKREKDLKDEKDEDERRKPPVGNDFKVTGGSSIRSTESFDSLAFQLEFIGQSLSLRSFLNRLTGSSLPFSIMEIEVRLDRESGSVEGRKSILENPFLSEENAELQSSAVQVPIISENESHYIVTLEFLELINDDIMSELNNLKKGGGDV